MEDDTVNLENTRNSSEQLPQREKNNDDSVTEAVVPMSKFWSRGIALWFMIIGITSIYILATVVPIVSNGILVETKVSRIDSLRKKYSQIIAVSAQTREDSLKKHIAMIWLKDSININPLTACTRHSDAVPENSWLRSIGFTMLSQVLYFIIFWAGALGGCIHGLTSLADYRGERRLFRSWVQWYLIKPVLGGFVSFVFIFILQTGLLSGNDGSKVDHTNIMGMCAIGVLAGLATETATDRFRDIFKAAFGNTNTKSDSLQKKEA